MGNVRVRIRFSKQGELRLIGHRDLARAMERLFRRAGLKLAFSRGFHPKPRISFPSALPLGVVGKEEVVEVELTEQPDCAELLTRLNCQTLPGLQFHKAECLRQGTPKAQLRRAEYELPIPEHLHDTVQKRVQQFLSASSWPVTQPEKNRSIDVRRFVEQLRLKDGKLKIVLKVERGPTASARDVLAALQIDGLLNEGVELVRTRVELV